MPFELDLTASDLPVPAVAINNLKVTDLDPLSRGSGVFPREIAVQGGGEDGALQYATWTGFPALAVDDYVICWDDDTDTILRVAGAGGNTSAVVDAADVTYTPATDADWDAATDPGNADDALDQLAERATASDNFFNGTFIESFDALVTSNGTTITMSLEQSGGGDLQMRFNDGVTVLDCTPAATIALTAGTVASPQANYIYVLETTKALTKSTSDWPATEHIKVGFFFVQTAVYVQSDGVLINQNWNDHRMGTDSQGHLSHIGEWIRRKRATWFSGIDGNGTDGYIEKVDASPDELYIKWTAGVVSQHHTHTVPAVDTSVSNDFHVVNDSTGAYSAGTDLADYLLDSTGASMSGDFYNLVIAGVANKTGEYSPALVLLPSGSYNNLSDAVADVNGYTSYSLPREFTKDSSTGFLIVRTTLKHSPAGGGSWTVYDEEDLDLRDFFEGGGSTGGAVTSEFADSQFSVFDSDDPTRILALDAGSITTGNTRTLVIPDDDGTIALTSNARAAEIRYEFNTTTTTGDPGAGKISITTSLGNYICMSDTDAAGNNREWLPAVLINNDYFVIMDEATGAIADVFQSVGNASDQTGWWRIAFSAASSVGTLTNGMAVIYGHLG